MKIAIVTGASSGLGKEFVKEISKRVSGLDEIWVIARRTDRLEQLQEDVSTRLVPITLDLSDSASTERLKSLLEERKPTVEILVNCAGYAKVGEFSEIPYDEEIGMVKLNCQSLTEITYVVLPFMTDGSRILQLASSAAFMPLRNMAVYAASKSYVLSFSKALHTELRERNISVTAVCPGPVDTEFFQIAETTKKMGSNINKYKTTADKVVDKAMRDAIARRGMSVYGTSMNAYRVLTKIVPHKWMMSFIRG